MPSHLDPTESKLTHVTRVFEGRQVDFLQARDTHGVPWLLRVLKSDFTDREAPLRFQKGFETLQRAAGAGVAKAGGWWSHLGSPCVALDASVGLPLQASLEGVPWPLEDTLLLGSQVARGLDRVHRLGLVHGDISTTTILWNGEQRQAHICGFEYSRDRGNGQGPVPFSLAPDASLACMPPECTGRLNRFIDAPTDLYALGCVLYRLLAGSFAFHATEPLGWVHAHVAQRPRSLDTAVPGVPHMVSRIVDRLLEKMPEQRYQSASSLHADLQRCLTALQDRLPIVNFPLGVEDFSGQLRNPTRLYGREADQQVLSTALDQVRLGAQVCVLVSGQAGVGKTALVHGICDKLHWEGGHFVSGKFDQYQRNLPYSALTQALEALLAVLREPVENGQPDRVDELASALGEDITFLQMLVPSLAKWTDHAAVQPPKGLSAPELRSRYCMVTRAFLQIFNMEKVPLVLVIDDLQWADPATLEILEHLMEDHRLPYFMLVLTYRDDEGTTQQALQSMLNRLQAPGRTPLHLPLKPLGVASLTEWLNDVLQGVDHFLEPLAHLVARKTGGIPFFVRRFLEYSTQKDWLRFCPGTRQWTWDADAIRSSAVADNIVEMLVSQFRQLPPAQCQLLATAALIGTAFHAGEAGTLQGLNPHDLWQAMDRLVGLGYVRNVRMGLYSFTHDRIQEAAVRLLDAPGRSAMHTRIAKLIWKLPGTERERRLYELLMHLTASLTTLAPLTDRIRYGKLALQANANAQGRIYAQHGLRLLGHDRWLEVPDLAFALHSKAQVGAYLCGDMDDGHLHYAQLLAHPRAPREMGEAHLCAIHLYTLHGHYRQATELGLQALSELGIHIQRDKLPDAAISDLDHYTRLIAEHGYEAIYAYDDVRDPEFEIVLSLMGGIAMPAFFTNPALAMVLGLRAAIFGIEYRQTQGVAFLWSIVGGAYLGFKHDYPGATSVARFAMRLAKRHRNDLQYAQACLVYSLTLHWSEPLAEVVAAGRQAHSLLNAYGMLPLAGLAFHQTIGARLEMGEPLADVAQEIEHGLAYASRTGNRHAEGGFLILQQVVAALQGRTEALSKLNGPTFDEATHLAELGENHIARAYFHIYKLVLANHAHDTELALEHVHSGAPLQGYILGFLANATYHFHAALAVASAAALKQIGLKEALHQIDISLDFMRRWTQSAPFTFGHKTDALQAVRAALMDQPWLALELFELALRGARQQGFVHEEALIARHACRVCSRYNLESVADGFEQMAARAYAHWGATALRPVATHGREPLGLAAGGHLDLERILKSAETISAELNYDALLHKLLVLVMENAGAESAVLLRPASDGEWVPEAWLADGASGAEFGQSHRGELPFSPSALALRSVLHTGKAQVFSDAAQDRRLARDPQVLKRKIRSVLCVPLVLQQQITAILYLENNRAPGVFTDRQVRVQGIMAGQAAIALESAKLYGGMEQVVRQRTRELEARSEELALEVLHRKSAQGNLQETQAELANTQRFAQGIVENAPYAVWVCSAQDRIVVFNAKATEITGYTRQDIADTVAWRIAMYPDPVYREAVTASVELDRLDGFQTRPCTYRITSKAGERKWLQLRSSTLPDGSSIVFGQDVSFYYEQAQQLEVAKLRAEDSTRAKGEFLANMSHEIRTPLNAVIGLSGLALKSEMPARVHEHLTKIQRSSEHLLGIINDILDFSKIESGKLEIEHVPFDLFSVIDNVVNLVAEVAANKGLELLCSVAPDIPRVLIGDPLRIGQILINYANNATKFTQRGSVHISVRVVESFDKDVLLDFSVTDTGIGIATDQIVRLFASFEQADASITREYGGTGLGLAISKSLAEAMGGAVGAHSVLGEGSTFWFTLRLGVEDNKAGRQESSLNRALNPIRGARILLAEDNDINQLVACEMLRDAGFEVDVAGNGQAAVHQIGQRFNEGRPYDLVLMDMQMPVMDGVSASQLIRQSYSAEQLPIVAMTANAMKADRDRCLAAGMNGFLTKPVCEDALWQALLRWIPVRPGLGDSRQVPRPVTHDLPDSDPLDVLMTNLRLVRDLDVHVGLIRTLNRPLFYVAMLRRFVAAQADATTRIRHCLTAGDFPAAEMIAHTLRSVSGNLGAVRLQNSAELLEAKLHCGTGTGALNAALEHTHQLLADLMRSLKQTPGLIAVPDAVPRSSLSEEERASALLLLAQIKVCLANADASAVELWEANAGVLRSLLAAVPGVEAAINGFDFEAALILLAQAQGAAE